MSDERSRMPDAKTKPPLEFAHCDLAGPIEQTAREGFKYALCFTHDFSSLITMYFSRGAVRSAASSYAAMRTVASSRPVLVIV